jgi:hypothetical protein
MTAPIGTTLNQYTGLREFGQVTNSYGGYLQSGGVAYNLNLPFFPDRFDWFRYTAFGTNDTNIQGTWFRDFPAGDALIIRRGTTDLTSTLETTNGVTNASTTGGFYNEHLTMSGATTATPCVVTTGTHNLTTGDRVIITKVIGTIAPELNNQTFVVRVLSSTTFSLYDVYGVPITTVGAYGSSGQVTKIAPAAGNPSAPTNPAYPHDAIIDQPSQAIITLGSAIMGADNDVIYFTAWKFNNYVNLGDVA